MRALRRRRFDDDPVEPPVPAMVRKRLVGGECSEEHCERLLKAALGLAGRHREAGKFVVAIPLADAEIEPPARQQIERRRLFGEQHRVVPRQDDDRRSEPQRRRLRRDPGQQVQRRRHLSDLGEMMLGDKAAVIAERLGLDMVLDKGVIAARAFRRRHPAPRRRAPEQSEPHRPARSYMLANDCIPRDGAR
ncbi:MAG TPA: hypothetical protein VGQ90_12005 [Stellaceae bacterium]|nr:hypothetical protein [Stellaceae bacterium]